jgi:hypothetical protein
VQKKSRCKEKIMRTTERHFVSEGGKSITLLGSQPSLTRPADG